MNLSEFNAAVSAQPTGKIGRVVRVTNLSAAPKMQAEFAELVIAQFDASGELPSTYIDTKGNPASLLWIRKTRDGGRKDDNYIKIPFASVKAWVTLHHQSKSEMFWTLAPAPAPAPAPAK